MLYAELFGQTSNKKKVVWVFKTLPFIYLHNGWVVSRPDKVSWVTPDKLFKSHLVSILHGSSKFCRQVLYARTSELVSLLQRCRFKSW